MIRFLRFRFHAHVGKLSKVLIKRGNCYVLRRSLGGEYTVDKVSLCSFVAFQRIDVDRHVANLDPGTRDQAPKCGGNMGPWMPIEGLEHKHTLRENDGQNDDDEVATIACIKELAGRPGMFLMILYQIADDQVSVDKPLFAQRVFS